MSDNNNGQASIGVGVLGKRAKKRRESVSAQLDAIVDKFEKVDETRSNLVEEGVALLESVGESEKNIADFVKQLTAPKE